MPIEGNNKTWAVASGTVAFVSFLCCGPGKPLNQSPAVAGAVSSSTRRQQEGGRWQLKTIQGLVSVADRVATRVIARERRGRILSNFHIVESMPKSVSKLIHYIHLVHGLDLCLV